MGLFGQKNSAAAILEIGPASVEKHFRGNNLAEVVVHIDRRANVKPCWRTRPPGDARTACYAWAAQARPTNHAAAHLNERGAATAETRRLRERASSSAS